MSHVDYPHASPVRDYILRRLDHAVPGEWLTIAQIVKGSNCSYGSAHQAAGGLVAEKLVARRTRPPRSAYEYRLA